jgi:type IV fimbrial biogenesis protein FimT
MVELMITVAVIAILSAIAVPSFREMVAGARLRSTAETFNLGLQLARSEAIKRNAQVFFSFTDTGWTVGCENVNADCPATIQSKPAAEGSQNVTLTASPAGATKSTFTGMGRLHVDGAGDLKNPDDSSEFDRIDFTNSYITREFSLIIRPTGQVKLCDSQAEAGSAREC